eukprot:389400-Rhodomonas_salina.2
MAAPTLKRAAEAPFAGERWVQQVEEVSVKRRAQTRAVAQAQAQRASGAQDSILSLTRRVLGALRCAKRQTVSSDADMCGEGAQKEAHANALASRLAHVSSPPPHPPALARWESEAERRGGRLCCGVASPCASVGLRSTAAGLLPTPPPALRSLPPLLRAASGP